MDLQKRQAIASRLRDEQRMVVNKTIYAKLKGTFDQRLQMKVFINEINHHLAQHPYLEFDKIGEAKDNPDRSKTYPILFKKKQAS